MSSYPINTATAKSSRKTSFPTPFETIQSTKNTWIKDLRRWMTRYATAKEDGVIVAEGEHLVIAGLEAGYPLRALFFLSPPEPKWAKLLNENTEIFITNERIMGEITSMDRPSTVLGVFMREVNGEAVDSRYPTEQDEVIVLDGLQDTGNVGTILRTVAALSHRFVVSLPGTVGLWHPKVLRAAQGAHFRLTLVEDFPIEEVMSHLPRHPLRIASMEGKSMFESNLKPAGLWVFGHEGQGVSIDVRKHSHQSVSVPMSSQTESLNVGVSVALILYEQYRQRLNINHQ